MSELAWHVKLHHLRFSRFILLIEKWMTMFLFCLAVAFPEFHRVIVVVVFVVLLIHFLVTHNKHFELESEAGMPSNQIVLRY